MPLGMILQTSDYDAEEVKPQCPYAGRNYGRTYSQWSHRKMARGKYRKCYIMHVGKNPVRPSVSKNYSYHLGKQKGLLH